MRDTRMPFAEKKFIEINGRRMAYLEEGEGPPLIFQHANPTSSYLWRNVMPHLQGLGRLIAADLIGMGDSDKLPGSGPQNYSFVEMRSFLLRFGKNSSRERRCSRASRLGFRPRLRLGKSEPLARARHFRSRKSCNFSRPIE